MVRQVPLGASGFMVSEFVFGAGSIGGVGASASTRGFGLSGLEAEKRLDEAWELGITMLDTADSYGGGQSEIIVGDWLKDRQPAGMVVGSKVGLVSNPDGTRGRDLSRARIEGQLKQSIDRLGRVDLYLTHAPDPNTPVEETVGTFSEMQDAGLIKAYGVSNVDARLLTEVLETADRHGWHRPVTIENRLNLLDRSDEEEILPMVSSEQLGYTPFSPLAGGVLSERYLDGAVPEEGSRIAVAGHLYYQGFHTPENLERVTALREVARDMGTSVSGLALAWLRDHPAITAPIVAPRTSAHWDAVHDADECRLDTAAHDRISQIFA